MDKKEVGKSCCGKRNNNGESSDGSSWDLSSLFSDVEDLEQAAEEAKKFFTQLGCVVAVFGVATETAFKVADNFIANNYTIAIINACLLGLIHFPTLVALVIIVLRDIIKKAIARIKATRQKVDEIEDAIDGDSEDSNTHKSPQNGAKPPTGETKQPSPNGTKINTKEAAISRNRARSHRNTRNAQSLNGSVSSRTRKGSKSVKRHEYRDRHGKRREIFVITNAKEKSISSIENTSLMSIEEAPHTDRITYDQINSQYYDRRGNAKGREHRLTPDGRSQRSHKSHNSGHDEGVSHSQNKNYYSLSETPRFDKRQTRGPLDNDYEADISSEHVFRRYFNLENPSLGDVDIYSTARRDYAKPSEIKHDVKNYSKPISEKRHHEGETLSSLNHVPQIKNNWTDSPSVKKPHNSLVNNGPIQPEYQQKHQHNLQAKQPSQSPVKIYHTVIATPNLEKRQSADLNYDSEDTDMNSEYVFRQHFHLDDKGVNGPKKRVNNQKQSRDPHRDPGVSQSGDALGRENQENPKEYLKHNSKQFGQGREHGNRVTSNSQRGVKSPEASRDNGHQQQEIKKIVRDVGYQLAVEKESHGRESLSSSNHDPQRKTGGKESTFAPSVEQYPHSRQNISQSETKHRQTPQHTSIPPHNLGDASLPPGEIPHNGKKNSNFEDRQPRDVHSSSEDTDGNSEYVFRQYFNLGGKDDKDVSGPKEHDVNNEKLPRDRQRSPEQSYSDRTLTPEDRKNQKEHDLRQNRMNSKYSGKGGEKGDNMVSNSERSYVTSSTERGDYVHEPEMTGQVRDDAYKTAFENQNYRRESLSSLNSENTDANSEYLFRQHFFGDIKNNDVYAPSDFVKKNEKSSSYHQRVPEDALSLEHGNNNKGHNVVHNSPNSNAHNVNNGGNGSSPGSISKQSSSGSQSMSAPPTHKTKDENKLNHTLPFSSYGKTGRNDTRSIEPGEHLSVDPGRNDKPRTVSNKNNVKDLGRDNKGFLNDEINLEYSESESEGRRRTSRQTPYYSTQRQDGRMNPEREPVSLDHRMEQSARTSLDDLHTSNSIPPELTSNRHVMVEIESEEERILHMIRQFKHGRSTDNLSEQAREQETSFTQQSKKSYPDESSNVQIEEDGRVQPVHRKRR